MTAAYRTGGTGNQIAAVIGDQIYTVYIVNGDIGTPTITDDQGGSYTSTVSALFGASTCMAWLFQRTALVTSTTTHTLPSNPFPTANNYKEFTFAFSGMTKFGSSSIKCSGTQANQALGGTPAPTLSQSAHTTNPLIGIVGNQRNGAGLSVTSGWTQRIDDGTQNTGDTFETGIDIQTRNSGFTGTTVTWGSTSLQAFGSIVVELDGGTDVDSQSSGSGPTIIIRASELFSSESAK